MAALVAYGCHRKGSRYRRRDFVWGRKVTSYKLQVSVEREGLGLFGVQAEDRPTNRPTNRPTDRTAAKQSKAKQSRSKAEAKQATRAWMGGGNTQGGTTLVDLLNLLPTQTQAQLGLGFLALFFWYALVLLWPCRLACMFKHVVVSCPVYVYMHLRGAEDMPSSSLSPGGGGGVCE